MSGGTVLVRWQLCLWMFVSWPWCAVVMFTAEHLAAIWFPIRNSHCGSALPYVAAYRLSDSVKDRQQWAWWLAEEESRYQLRQAWGDVSTPPWHRHCHISLIIYILQEVRPLFLAVFFIIKSEYYVLNISKYKVMLWLWVGVNVQQKVDVGCTLVPFLYFP